MRYLFVLLALLCLAAPVPLRAETVTLTDGTWTAPSQFNNSSPQAFSWSHPNASGFIQNVSGGGLWVTHLPLTATPGSTVTVRGTIFAGEYGGVRVNGVSYAANLYDCTHGGGPCVSGSVTLEGIAVLPNSLDTISTITFPFTVTGHLGSGGANPFSLSLAGVGVGTMVVQSLSCAQCGMSASSFTGRLSSPIPEPATALLLLSGLALLASARNIRIRHEPPSHQILAPDHPHALTV